MFQTQDYRRIAKNNFTRGKNTEAQEAKREHRMK